MPCIYWVSEGYIQQYSPPRPRFFTSEVESRGHAVPPEGLTEDVKNRGQGGYIIVYSQTRPNI